MGPEAIIPRIPLDQGFTTRDDDAWARVAAVTLMRCEDGAPPSQATSVRLAYHAKALLIRFDCRDRDIWATHTERDAPLWEEEVVEVFLAPGAGLPAEYVEIEVNPLGTIFDARVANPHGRRDSMRVDATWDAPGLVAAVDRATPGSWRVDLTIPWGALCDGPPPRVWRGNLFRVERPRDGDAELCCWSPTLTLPADFHKPACFGTMVLDRHGAAP